MQNSIFNGIPKIPFKGYFDTMIMGYIYVEEHKSCVEGNCITGLPSFLKRNGFRDNL